MLVSPSDLADAPPLWVDTGSEQLVIPLASVDAVNRAAPNADLHKHGSSGHRTLAYVFAREGDHVTCRFFFPSTAPSSRIGHGSACANLAAGSCHGALPQRLTLDQGAEVGRPCRSGSPSRRRRHRSLRPRDELQPRHADLLTSLPSHRLRRQRETTRYIRRPPASTTARLRR
jgi:predicted PhzF superfamily epimerase YddE/YHI9